MALKPAKVWLTIIPMEYRDIPEFWQRDAGLVCLGFRQIGVESKFIALGAPAVREDRPLILATRRQMEDADWWSQWGAEGVVLWRFHQVDAIARAIRATGAKLVMHLDTDGLCSTHVAFGPYLHATFQSFRSNGRRPAWLLAAAKSVLYHYFPRLHDRDQQVAAELADLMTINSPVAQQRFRRLLRQWGLPGVAERVQLIPSPLSPDADWEPGTEKRPQIVAAGRWESYQKDAPKAMRVLARVLQAEPTYSALLIGGGREVLDPLRRRLPPALQSRVQLRGYVERAELMQIYRQSRIMFVSSRFESLNLAAVEALACGCSVVGPACIPSMSFLNTACSGTLALTRSDADFADALCGEIEAWRRGARDPQQISRHWRQQFLASNYASSVLEYFGLPNSCSSRDE